MQTVITPQSSDPESSYSVSPTRRPLTGVAYSPFSSSTPPLRTDSVALRPGNKDRAWNLLYPLAVTLSTSNTVTFEIFGNLYPYTEEYHESWMEWGQGTPGYIGYTTKYGGKKNIGWNSDLRATKVSNYFQQCADPWGSAIGTPRVMCIMCKKVLAHPSGPGLARCITITARLLVCNPERSTDMMDGPEARLV